MQLGSRPRWRGRALATTALLTSTLVSGALFAAPASAAAPPTTIGLIGDTPYDSTQRAAFPRLVNAINADPAITWVFHAGDTKSGTSRCNDAWLTDRRNLFNTFADPFVLTPGDNDWTDCHTSAGGRYLPTERLNRLRQVLYPTPGQTLGRAPATVTTQAIEQAPTYAAFRENVRFVASDVVVATIHVVGSKNDTVPWSGLVGGDRPSTRTAEFNARRAANLAWINRTFDIAVQNNAPGVLILTQAETTTSSYFSAERNLIANRAREFAKPVLFVHGDEHHFESQTNFAGVANLTRLETYGETASNWLRLTIDPSTAAVFSWQSRRV